MWRECVRVCSAADVSRAQVKVSAALGEARQYLVLVGGADGARRLAAGPARLHLLERRVALTRGVPPRLLAVWDIAHLRYSH